LSSEDLVLALQFIIAVCSEKLRLDLYLANPFADLKLPVLPQLLLDCCIGEPLFERSEQLAEPELLHLKAALGNGLLLKLPNYL